MCCVYVFHLIHNLDVIIKHFSDLTAQLNHNDISDQLYQEGLISCQDHDAITNQYHTTMQQGNRILLKALEQRFYNNKVEDFKKFLWILKKCAKYDPLVKKLQKYLLSK